MCLETAIGAIRTDAAYVVEIAGGVGDWSSLIAGVRSDQAAGTPVGMISAKFHNALVEWIRCVASLTTMRNVVLSGGVFQNAYLVRRARAVLESDGFNVFTHRQVPANDGGLALGQAVLAGLIH